MSDYKKRMLDIMQEMEELHGPELIEYVEIMGDIATEAEQRCQAAMMTSVKQHIDLPDPVDEEFMQKSKETYEDSLIDDHYGDYDDLDYLSDDFPDDLGEL